MNVFSVQALPKQPGPTDHFSGNVQMASLAQGERPSCLTSFAVTFDRSARSAWHTHPKGQLLIVTDGTGIAQEWGKPARKITKGDVVWTPPGVKHWHGATPDSQMTHFAIQEHLDGKNVDWLEKVSDEDYASAVGESKGGI